MSYGCHSRAAYARVLPVQDGWYLDGHSRTPKMAAMPFRMAPDCQFTLSDLGQVDKRCAGCKHKQETK